MDEERVKAIFQEIAKYELELDSDPASRGPQYLQESISVCRGYINAVSKILRDILKEKQVISMMMARHQSAYEVESADLLATNETIRRMPNIKDRQAMINVHLRDRVKQINDLKMQLTDLDFVEKAVKHQHKELKDTMAEIRLQRSLIRDEIDTGSMYGDESDKSRGSLIPVGMGDEIDDDELAKILSGELAAGMGDAEEEDSGTLESEETPVTMASEQPDTEDLSDEEAMTRFLDETPSMEDQEFSDILDAV